MRIFIAGATGVLGTRLVRRLSDDGHDVVGIARSVEKAELVRSLGGTPARVHLFDADAVARAAKGAELIVHAATAIPHVGRSRGEWDANDRIRREGTQALVKAATAVGAARYLQQSVVWVVRSADPDTPYDESTPADPPALLASAIDGEEIAMAGGDREGFAVGVLRCGTFYSSDAAHTRTTGSTLVKRRLPIVGRGETVMAPIHVDDAAAAFVAAAEAKSWAGSSNIWHVVDDEPIPSARFLRAFAELLGAPAPRRIPVWLARLVLGGHLVESLTTSMNTTNGKIRDELGWAPQFPTYREGLAEVVEAWREESFLVEAAV